MGESNIIKKIISLFIILLFIGVSSAQTTNKTDSNSYVLIRVDADINLELLDNYEIVGQKPGEWIDLILKNDQLKNLNLPESKYKILIYDVGLYDETVASDYHSFPQFESFLNDIADTYPEITKLSSIGKSYENRDIWLMEISDNPGVSEDEPGVFFMGLHHAREWPSLEICLYIIEKLTTLYNSDSEIKNIVDNRRILIVPCANPDGYYRSHDEGQDWRKNMHVFPEFSSTGVDLNRNYAGSCNGDPLGSWGTISGSVSHSSDSEVYCGPDSMSELEIQAVRDVFLNYDLCASISWHTYSELVLWPWGYSTGLITPDNQYMSQVGTEIANRISTQEEDGSYNPIQSSELYPTTGDTTDWAYGYYHYVLGKTMFAYTIEACSSFHPSSSYLDQILKENYDGALFLLNEAENINNVVPRVLPPDIKNIEMESENSIKIFWEEKNSKANPNKFELEELSKLNLLLDDAEKEPENWILDGFERSIMKSNSGQYSYHGSKKQGRVYTMTSKYPTPVTDDMNLSFWCNYDLIDDLNFVYLEISKYGRNYEIIDTFTGSSGGWIKKGYNLDEYFGESIFIRFRLVGESYEYGYGFYLDDIFPVAEFNSERIISDNIISNFYQINNLNNGTYYYRVKGYNDERGWGDYSSLKSTIIGNSAPIKPKAPTGSNSGKPGASYGYSAKTTDPNGDKISYIFDWGDGTYSNWIGPVPSGQTVSASHIWSAKGTYQVKVLAKDEHDLESEWSEPNSVTMPKSKIIHFSFIEIVKEIFKSKFWHILQFLSSN